MLPNMLIRTIRRSRDSLVFVIGMAVREGNCVYTTAESVPCSGEALCITYNAFSTTKPQFYLYSGAYCWLFMIIIYNFWITIFNEVNRVIAMSSFPLSPHNHLSHNSSHLYIIHGDLSVATMFPRDTWLSLWDILWQESRVVYGYQGRITL